jgi:homoserine O-succinyltransferase/O-acetyltransferase
MPVALVRKADPTLQKRGRSDSLHPDCLDIGIINNMPDATLEATERQFTELLDGAAETRPIRLRFFSLPEITRCDDAASRVRDHYDDFNALTKNRLDGLIITGCEPKAASLTDEPYWKNLTRVIDWAEHNTSSTIFSCLAAHAAVLHLDGINRSPVDKKFSGVFDCVKVSDHPLLRGVAPPLRRPHSRMNTLLDEELVAHGYSVLTSSPKAGVDSSSSKGIRSTTLTRCCANTAGISPGFCAAKGQPIRRCRKTTSIGRPRKLWRHLPQGLQPIGAAIC